MRRYLIALAIFILGPILGTLLMIYTIRHVIETGFDIASQGTTIIHVTKAGHYELWRSSLKKTMPASQSIQIISVATQRPLSFIPSQDNQPTKFMEGYHQHLGFIPITIPGKYQIKLTGRDQQVKYWLHPPYLMRMLIFFALSFTLAFGGMILGVIIAVVTLLQRSQAPHVAADKPPLNTTHLGRGWAIACHATALCGFIIPLSNLFIPWLIWLMKHDEFPFVNDQGKESLNFQLSIVIYSLISSILIFLFIGFILLTFIALFDIIAIVIACIDSSQGKAFRYPLCLRLIK